MSFLFHTSSAEINVTNQPASQGRPVTSAGALVLDANTRQPASGCAAGGFCAQPGQRRSGQQKAVLRRRRLERVSS